MKTVEATVASQPPEVRDVLAAGIILGRQQVIDELRKRMPEPGPGGSFELGEKSQYRKTLAHLGDLEKAE